MTLLVSESNTVSTDSMLFVVYISPQVYPTVAAVWITNPYPINAGL